MQEIPENHPLRRYFSGLVEDAFCSQVGMCDPILTDYVADLLINFTHVEQLQAIRNAEDKRLDQIAAMLAIASDERPKTSRERDCTMYRYIGDYTLFWAGVFPEDLKKRRRKADVLLDYVSQGKKCYAIVSQLAEEDDAPPPSLFRHLSEDFEYCLYGLGLVRRCWEETEKDGSDLCGDIVY